MGNKNSKIIITTSIILSTFVLILIIILLSNSKKSETEDVKVSVLCRDDIDLKEILDVYDRIYASSGKTSIERLSRDYVKSIYSETNGKVQCVVDEKQFLSSIEISQNTEKNEAYFKMDAVLSERVGWKCFPKFVELVRANLVLHNYLRTVIFLYSIESAEKSYRGWGFRYVKRNDEFITDEHGNKMMVFIVERIV